ncbi:hypothetical protein [Halalkalibacter urbisdiaboli]|nr:hypothetical protein [Halalkalibacter urbisdiaboli]
MDIAHMRRLGSVDEYVASSNTGYHSLLISRVERLLIELKGDA